MWYSMIMVASEFIEFRRDLEREYLQEIAGGYVAGFTFFSCKQETRDYFFLREQWYCSSACQPGEGA